MYDTELLDKAFRRNGLTIHRLGALAKVNFRTAKKVIETGQGHPDSVFKVAKTLGFPVTRSGRKPNYKYDFSSILSERKTA